MYIYTYTQFSKFELKWTEIRPAKTWFESYFQIGRNVYLTTIDSIVKFYFM